MSPCAAFYGEKTRLPAPVAMPTISPGMVIAAAWHDHAPGEQGKRQDRHDDSGEKSKASVVFIHYAPSSPEISGSTLARPSLKPTGAFDRIAG